VIALIIFFVTYSGFALSRNVAFIGLLFAFYGLYQGVFRSVGKALASDYVPESLHAGAIGWYNTTIGVFGLIASLIAGRLWDHVGHASVFLFGAVFAAVGALAILALVPARARRQPAD
jgi:MFS family permease